MSKNFRKGDRKEGELWTITFLSNILNFKIIQKSKYQLNLHV